MYLIKTIPIFLLFLVVSYTVAFAQNNLSTVQELTSDTSGWGAFKSSVNGAKNKFELLPADPARAKEALYQTQVTTHSIMGAIIYFSGGILIDNGWIRILGSGNEKLDRSLPAWNKGKAFKEFGERPGFLLIADDVIGGFFAINGGALGTDMGKVFYLPPDRLKWEDLNFGYSDFIDFCFNGDLENFYKGTKWRGWKEDLAKIRNPGLFLLPLFVDSCR